MVAVKAETLISGPSMVERWTFLPFVKTLSFIFLETLPDGSEEQFAHLYLKSYPQGCGGQVREGEGVHKMETSKKQAHPGKTSSEFKTSITRLICILNLVFTKWKPPKNKLTQVNET